MKKRTFTAMLGALFCAALLSTCTNPYGSVGKTAVEEALASRAMAVTPCIPGWLLEPSQIHRLSSHELKQLRTILRQAPVRKVHEKYYRDPSLGNRGDTTEHIFYLYASNAQCLGGRVIGEKVLLDDFDLTDDAAHQLYALLRPHLDGIIQEN